MPGSEQKSFTLADWSNLPEELWILVFTSLEPPDLGRAAQVCQQWARLIRAETLWKLKCKTVAIEKEAKEQILKDRTDLSSWKVSNYIMNVNCTQDAVSKLSHFHRF